MVGGGTAWTTQLGPIGTATSAPLTTASFSSILNGTYFLCITYSAGPDTATSVTSTNNITFTKVTNITFSAGAGAMEIWMGPCTAAAAGTVTINGYSSGSIIYTLDKVNVIATIQQTVSATATKSVAFPLYKSPYNWMYAFGHDNTAFISAVKSGWTFQGGQSGTNNDATFYVPGPDTSASFTSSGGSTFVGIIGLELSGLTNVPTAASTSTRVNSAELLGTGI